MNKNMIVAAMALALATPMAVNADATMYGQVRVATQNHSRSDAQGAWGMVDHSSRLGVKGDEDLGNGLKAIFQLEFTVDVGDGFGDTGKSSSGFGAQRDSFIGLAGAFGTVLMGRHDTPLKMSSGKLDFFADTNLDNDNGFLPGNSSSGMSSIGVGLFDSRRVDGAIAYVSPNLAGLTLIGAAVQSNTSGFNDAQDFAGAYSIAGIYSNGPWYASAAYETIDLSSLNGTGVGTPVNTKWRVGAGMLDFNNISASFIYEERTEDGFFDDKHNYGRDSSSWQLQAAYRLPGDMRVKGMYGQFDGINGDNMGETPNFDVWGLGMEYNLSKRTDIQVLYRAKTYDVSSKVKPFKGLDVTDDVFALQLDHSF